MDVAATTAQQLAAIVESSDDAILSTDLDSIVLTWNRGAERIYGYTAEEMVGRHFSLLIPDNHPDELRGIVDRVKAGKRIETYETIRRAKDGRLVEVALTVSPLRDASGQIVGSSAIARDITTRKQAEWALRTSEARLRSIVESAVDAIIVIDGRGRVELFSPAAERLFGYEVSEVIGQSMMVLVPEAHRERHTQYVAAPQSSGMPMAAGEGREMAGRRKDGSVFPIFLSVGEMVVGQDRKFTAIVRDLTARVQLETQMREQESLARLGEMAAVIAHEVRNPLAAVKGAIQVIGGRLPAGNTDASVIADIVARLDTLNELMKDILLFARPPRPRPSTVAIAPLLQATSELCMKDPAFKAINVQMTGEAPAVAGDAELLKIVFLNLLINSAQAMRGQGTIRVGLGTASAGVVIVTVSDSGPGIPEDIRDRIFTPFFTTKARGTGLGLPTAKRLVDAHDGHIRVTCLPEGGTTVIVELPAAK
jgi:two-component system sensor kinase FixL